MQKEGLRNAKNAKQERFPMPPHQVALLVLRECIHILEVQFVLDVPNNEMNIMYIVVRLEERENKNRGIILSFSILSVVANEDSRRQKQKI